MKLNSPPSGPQERIICSRNIIWAVLLVDTSLENNVSEFEEGLPSGGDSGGDLNGPGSFWSKSTRPSTCQTNSKSNV